MNSKNGTNKRKHIWQKAFSVSFAFHLLVILTVGAMAASFHQEIQQPQEQLITVNLADTPEEIAKAQENASPFSKLKNMLESPAKNSESPTKDNSSKDKDSNSPTKSDSSNSTPDSNSETAAPGEISSPDGILPPSQGGGGDSTESESTGGGSESGGESTGGGGSESGGGSSTGNGSGSGGVDAESAQNVANRFSAAVNSNKQYPRAAVRLNQQGTVGLNVVLDADGNLVSASVTSSVNGNLDKAAINAVYATCPFPHRHGSSVNMNINVNFYLQ